MSMEDNGEAATGIVTADVDVEVGGEGGGHKVKCGEEHAAKSESKGGSETGEVTVGEEVSTQGGGEKPDLNKSGVEAEEEAVGDEEDVVILPAKSFPSKATAPACKDKDELLLTLGGSWGSKKFDEVVREKISGNALAATAADISLSLGSSGNPVSTSVLSGKALALSVRSVSNTTTLSPSNTKSFVHNPSCSLTHNSLEELNSSATQYVAGHENETVSHGGLFAHLASDPGAQRYRSAPFESSGTVFHNNNALPGSNNGSYQGGGAKLAQLPAKWNSYNLEKYHALFPDLKEGFRARYAGSKRSKLNKQDDLGRSPSNDNRVGLQEIASDPIASVAHKLQELPDIFLDDLKKSLTEMLGSVDKRDEFLKLQRILHRRNDLSAETLYLAHRTQLELLVAMKTGIQAFLLRENPLSTSALVDIFLQKRCRNFGCQSQLPVDDCDCQLCSQKEGFCSACMCIACSKFDFMANTCRWVGCDFCLHWCHTDCGIRLSYIRPGSSSAQGAASKEVEMQFVCAACNHASDLFGFVREVFMTYSKDWSPETLRQELDCIHRIFRRSSDFRGKQLCWLAERMLGRVVEGCIDTSEICGTIVRFFQEGKADVEAANGNNQRLHQAAPRSVATAGEKKAGVGAGNGFLMLEPELEAKREEMAELRARKRSEIEEIESLIHIKQAEAKMFELRAGEARLEADRLRKIVVAKSEKIEEEYVAKGYKLHINDAVEKRKRCFAEYQMLEQGLHDFSSMKAKLVTDVHDVLRKMDVLKRNHLS